MCSEPSRADDGPSKPEGSKVTAKKPITSKTAAEIAVETSEREMSDGDEMAVWVWQPGRADEAREYFVRVSMSWHFHARPNDPISDRAKLEMTMIKGGPSEILGAIGAVEPLVSLAWKYSRNQRRHTAFDATGDERFWIESCAPYGSVQGKHGYRLRFPDGGHIRYSRYVGLLKGVAASKANAAGEPRGN